MNLLSERNIADALRTFGSLSCERGPTIRELQNALGLASTSSVVTRLATLQRRGWIARIPPVPYGSDARGWRLTATGRAEYEQQRTESVQT